jgi:hypothetical protein
MAVVLRLRGVDGKYVKGEAKNLEKSMTTFASNVIKDGRAILNTEKKRTQKNTLFNEYSYVMKSSKSTLTLGFEFGGASNYWKFVDQGVQGKGYADASEDVEQLPMLGQGSPFKFKYSNPGGALVNAIQGWIKNKPASLGGRNEISAAWGIGYSIKRRGLQRTMFYTRPVENALKTLPDDVLEAFRLDFSKLIDKLPSKTIIE